MKCISSTNKMGYKKHVQGFKQSATMSLFANMWGSTHNIDLVDSYLLSLHNLVKTVVPCIQQLHVLTV